MDCAILGDDVGIGIHHFRKECASYSVVGIDSQKWNHRFRVASSPANTVIISLGKNDKDSVDTRKELSDLRKKLGNVHVFWVVPASNTKAREAILELAGRHGDDTIEMTGKISEKEIRAIANTTKNNQTVK